MHAGYRLDMGCLSIATAHMPLVMPVTSVSIPYCYMVSSHEIMEIASLLYTIHGNVYDTMITMFNFTQ